jgi:fibronectin type 3 domain-containing protein
MKNYEKNLLKLFCVAAAFAFSACSIPINDGEGTQKADASAIPVPQNVTAQVKTTSRIDLAWQADTAAASYSVYRSSEEDGGYTGIATIKESSYIDNSVAADTEYFYYITLSANNRGESGKSATVRAATRAPDIPQGLKTTPVSESSIKLEWDAVSGVTGYKVYKSESDSDGEYTEKESVTEREWIDTGLIADTSYYYKVEAINGIEATMSAPVEGKIIPPPAPETPVISTADGELTLSWQTVAGAAAYEIYIGTSNDSANAEKNGSDINGSLSKTISGLTNGTTYYLWIKAKNILGTSGFSPVASGKPLGTPETPSISANTSGLIATWTTVAGADEYEVYCDTSSEPTTLYTTVSGTTANITELIGWTLYYVRLKAKNATGTSAYGQTASGTPTSAGLYDNVIDMPHKIGNQNLAGAVTYLSSNAVSGHNYTIVLGANESVSPCTLSYPERTVGITVMGIGAERTISLSANGSLFTVGAGVTLTLGDKITLVGRSSNNNSLVSVTGALVMNDGSKITGNTDCNRGG